MRDNEEEWKKSPKYHQRMEVTQEEEEDKCANDINTRYEGDETSEQSEEVEKCINAQESEGGESKGSSEVSNQEENASSNKESEEGHGMETGKGEIRNDSDRNDNVNHGDMCGLSDDELDKGWENQDATWNNNKYWGGGEEKERNNDDIWGEDESVTRN